MNNVQGVRNKEGGGNTVLTLGQGDETLSEGDRVKVM